MLSAAIFHGTGCTAESFWIPWLRQNLEENGFEVWAPSLPADENGLANLDVWEAETIKTAPRSDFDLIVGHSAGVPHILRLLSGDNFRAYKAVLVAGFIVPLEGMKKDHPTYPHRLNHEKIRVNCRDFTYIHSHDDPWGCTHEQGEAMRKIFGGTLIAVTGEGHFGSAVFDQPYPTFPLLLAHCLL